MSDNMSEEKQIVSVEIEALNNVLEYLSEQSFKDVAGLINSIQKSVQENNKPEQREGEEKKE